MGLDMTTASFLDLEYDLNKTSAAPVILIKGKDIASFGVIYFRVVSKHFEDASIVADYARKNGVKVVDGMYQKSLFIRLPLAKGLETKLLFENGIPVPRTLFMSLKKIGKQAPKIFGFPFVIKGTNGKRGRAVWLSENKKQLDGLIEDLTIREILGERFLAQEFIKASIRVRVLVIGGKAMAAIVRPTRWKDHFGKEGPVKMSYKKVPHKYSILAERAVNALSIDVAGVDILEDENGNLFILEVNSAPKWDSIKEDTGLNVEREIIKFLITDKPRSTTLMDDFAKDAAKLGYFVHEYPADKRVYEISKNGKTIFTFKNLFSLNSTVATKLTKRKNLTKEILRKCGIPTPAGILAGTWEEVLQSLKTKKISFPLVIKPDTASSGKFVAAKLENVDELKETFNRVREKYKSVLIEEYVEGEDYRFLVLDGRVLAVARRVLPSVVGDGNLTIIDLIEKYNNGRIEPLILNYEVERMLTKQVLGYNSVPAKGEKITLRMNANAHTGGTVENVEHFDLKYSQIAIKATKALGLRFCGVDIISPNIHDAHCRFFVIEINGAPGYDLHWEVEKGKKYDATKDILKSLFSSGLEQ